VSTEPAVLLTLMSTLVLGTPQERVARDSAGVSIIRVTVPLDVSAARIRINRNPITSLGGARDSNTFDRILSVTLSSANKIVVVTRDAPHVRGFTMDGRMAWTAGRRGRGPGEFVELSGIASAPGGTTFLQDDRRADIVGVDDGARVIGRLAPLKSGVIPRIHAPAGPDRFVCSIAKSDSVGPVEVGPYSTPMEFGFCGYRPQEWRPFAIGIERQFEFIRGDGAPERYLRPFGVESTIRSLGDRVVIGDGEEFEMREFSGAGALRSILRVVSPPVSVTSAHRDDEMDRLRELYRRPGWNGLERLWIAAKWRTRVPAYRTFLLDASGNLWVELWTSSVQPSRWLVFDARLRLLGSVSLPPNWRLWQIGTERATATEIDKFGVSQIHVLQVLPDRSDEIHVVTRPLR